MGVIGYTSVAGSSIMLAFLYTDKHLQSRHRAAYMIVPSLAMH